MSLIRREESSLDSVFNNYIQKFEPIYIEQIYNIVYNENVYNENINNIYGYITKYIKSSKRKIIDCIKKNRFSINDLIYTIKNYKQNFIFLLNFDTNYNNNMNNIIFNELIIEQNISLLIYNELYNNNIKLQYFLKNNKPSDNKNIATFDYSYNKYIIEMLKLNIIETNSSLYNNMILHNHINKYINSKKTSTNNKFIVDNSILDIIVIEKYNSLFQHEDSFDFIINNINYLVVLAKKYICKHSGLKFITLIISKCITDERLYKQNINNFTNYFLNIIWETMLKKCIVILLLNSESCFINFIKMFTYIIYEYVKTHKENNSSNNCTKAIIACAKIIDYYKIFKIKFFEKIKEVNTEFLLNKNDKVVFTGDKNIMQHSHELHEYIYNTYKDFNNVDNFNNNIVNPYYWNINNSDKYIIDKKNNQNVILNYLHMGKTIINFNYRDNILQLTMLPLQFHIFSYFNEHMKFPDKLGTYNKNDIDKVIQSFINSNLIIFNNSKYTINDDIKNINTNLIDVYYNSDNTIINSIKKSTFVMDIKYIIAANIKNFLKIKANNLDNIYKYLVDKLDINIYNITNKKITNTLEYMIKQDYIYLANNMYHITLY